MTIVAQRSSQTIFLSRRNIMEGVAVLHETIHEFLGGKKMNVVTFKTDFENGL